MSDRELVTFDPKQFDQMASWFDLLNRRLAHIEQTLSTGLEAVAEGSNTSDNSEVLTAINNLDRKVDKFMASQEERLKTIQGQLSGIASGIDTLQQQIADVKANNPELEDELSGIESTVAAMRDDLNPPAPATAPAPVEGEPPA